MCFIGERWRQSTYREVNMDARELVPRMDSPGRLESRERRSWVIVIVLSLSTRFLVLIPNGRKVC